MKLSLLAAAVLSTAGAASASTTFLTFHYDNLAGAYNSTTGSFTANAVAAGPFQSVGTVTELVPASNIASFQPGTLASATANFALSMSITGTGSTRSGIGSFTITDADGDRITGDLNGSWFNLGGSALFNGLLTNVVLHSDTDGLFEGTSGGAINFASLPGQSPYEGAMVQLAAISSNFFATSFSDVNTNTDGQLIVTVPIPTSALAGLSGLALAGFIRARRR